MSRHDIKKSIIRDALGGELLVALREATEGKRFDEIIIDEYQRIPSRISTAILLACMFS